MSRDAQGAPPPEFERALLSLKGLRLRPELRLEEVPAPTRIAPFALALTAEVNPSPEPETLLGSGRFVVLYDPDGQEAWNGSFRVIAMGRAQLERELGADPFLGEVGWAWLTDALEEEHAGYHSLSGSVTRVLSESFGGLELRDAEVEIEIRASWTPRDADLGPHLRAWALMACSAAGLPPVPENVTALGSRR